jgi:hypothetical protein
VGSSTEPSLRTSTAVPTTAAPRAVISSIATRSVPPSPAMSSTTSTRRPSIPVSGATQSRVGAPRSVNRSSVRLRRIAAHRTSVIASVCDR